MSDTQTTDPDPADAFLRDSALGGIILPRVRYDGLHCTDLMPNTLYLCRRPRGHTGRHHWTWSGFGGILRHVWGEDTEAPRRHRAQDNR